ncbi:MAG: hypothetical protein H3C59_09185 [Burkholderiaceae bacterium]|nr:hypothetical protein [Burkholderiaceae bacterium]
MVGDIAAAVVRRGLSAGVNLVATSYLAHRFGSGQMGAYVGMLTLGQLLNVALVCGLDVTPAYLMRSHPAQHRRVWEVTTATSLILASVAGALWLLSGFVIPWLGSAGDTFHTWGGAPFLYAAGLLLMQPQYACLQGLLHLNSFNVLQVLYPVAFLIGILVLENRYGALTPSSAIVLLGAVGVATAAGGALLVLRAIRATSGPVSPYGVKRSLRRAFLDFSLGSYVANIIGSLNSRLPALLSALMLVPTAAGTFAGAVIINDLFAFFSHAIASITFPKLAGSADMATRLRDLGLACRINTTATLGAALVFVALFDLLVPMMLGPTFAGVRHFVWLAVILLACAVLQSTARLLCTDFASQGRPYVNAWLNVPSLIVFLVLFVLTTAHWQEWGAVISFASASILFSSLTFIVHKRHSGLSLKDVGLLSRSDVRLTLDLLRMRRRRPQS